MWLGELVVSKGTWFQNAFIGSMTHESNHVYMLIYILYCYIYIYIFILSYISLYMYSFIYICIVIHILYVYSYVYRYICYMCIYIHILYWILLVSTWVQKLCPPLYRKKLVHSWFQHLHTAGRLLERNSAFGLRDLDLVEKKTRWTPVDSWDFVKMVPGYIWLYVYMVLYGFILWLYTSYVNIFFIGYIYIWLYQHTNILTE